MALRDTNLERLARETFDVLIIGGGINGAVSAAALAARGAKVALIDRGDFAGVTSQESSNLAWGGIKYMESFEFGLVRKLCLSRNHLIESYPSTVQEIRFYVVHERGFRHGLWKLVLGTWFYWLIGSFFTRRPRRLSRRTMAAEEPILALGKADGGFEYSDAYLHDNDARFVWNFIRRRAQLRLPLPTNYVEALSWKRDVKATCGWSCDPRRLLGSAKRTGRSFTLRAKVVVNACGPYVDEHERAGRAADRAPHHVVLQGRPPDRPPS